MAWNEPGNDKDPWNNNRGDQGPPDLDEAFRKLQNQLGNIFGGGSGPGGSSGGGSGISLSSPLIFGILGVLLIGYGISGFYQLDQQERGVVLRFGEARENVVQPGLRWRPPIVDEVIPVNVTRVRSNAHSSAMLTEDENIVEVSLTVQWVVDNPTAFALFVRSPESSLEQATESALRHVVGSSAMHDVLTEGRPQIAAEVHERIQLYMNNYGTGIRVSKVNIDDAAPPRQVQAAFDDVQRAREDEQRVKNEAEEYANGVIPEARGRAQRLKEEANAYRDRVIAQAEGEAKRFTALLAEYEKAPQVTRERLYLDTLEDIMRNSSKVLIDVEGGNNLLYLPLDQITRQAAGAAGGGSGDMSRQEVRDIVNDALRNRQPTITTRRDSR